jgi:hypothetical protein
VQLNNILPSLVIYYPIPFSKNDMKSVGDSLLQRTKLPSEAFSKFLYYRKCIVGPTSRRCEVQSNRTQKPSFRETSTRVFFGHGPGVTTHSFLATSGFSTASMRDLAVLSSLNISGKRLRNLVNKNVVQIRAGLVQGISLFNISQNRIKSKRKKCSSDTTVRGK